MSIEDIANLVEIKTVMPRDKYKIDKQGQMSSFKIIMPFVFLMTLLTLHAQHVDSVKLDMKRLSRIEFFKKYSLNENKVSKQDITVTMLIWSVHHLKRENKLLRQKGIKTITIIESRPSKNSPYYIIGHYQDLSETNHMFRMSLYKIDPTKKIIYFEHWYDSANDKWEIVH